jgi:hypothetical protein
MPSYLSGQAKVYEAVRNAAGDPQSFRFMGNSPQFDLAGNINTVEHQESQSGQRLVDLRLITGKKLDLTLNVQEFLPENLALLLFGNLYTSVSGSVTGEQLGGGATGITAGMSFALKNANITSLVITDSAGTPATLASGTDYSANLPYGLVTILNVGSYTQPFKAAYSKAVGQKSVDMFTNQPANRWFRLIGVNTAQQNSDGSFKRFVVDLYNVQIDPGSSIPFISDAIADMSVKASVLVDTTRSATAQGGQIGLVTLID